MGDIFRILYIYIYTHVTSYYSICILGCEGGYSQGGQATNLGFVILGNVVHDYKSLKKYWLMASNPLKNISQLGRLFPISGEK